MPIIGGIFQTPEPRRADNRTNSVQSTPQYRRSRDLLGGRYFGGGGVGGQWRGGIGGGAVNGGRYWGGGRSTEGSIGGGGGQLRAVLGGDCKSLPQIVPPGHGRMVNRTRSSLTLALYIAPSGWTNAKSLQVSQIMLISAGQIVELSMPDPQSFYSQDSLIARFV